MDAIEKYLVVPFIAVIGIYIVGVTIESLFHIPQAAAMLFSAVGGICFVARLYTADNGN
jgi:hypothetical protein